MPEQEKICYVCNKNEWLEAEFLGIYQFSNVIEPSPFVGGHKGGVVAYPVAVVKLNGKLTDFSISKIKFSKD